MTQPPVRIGIVGCGSISSTYLRMAPTFEILEVAACADLVPERAIAQAEEFGVRRACAVDELMADPEIEVVVNLTVPKAHADVGLAALEAGKSLYNEKTAGRHPRRGAPDARLGAAERRAYRRGTGHLSGRRVADLPQVDRRRLDRRTGGGHSLHDGARPRALASRSGIFFTSRGAVPCSTWGHIT